MDLDILTKLGLVGLLGIGTYYGYDYLFPARKIKKVTGVDIDKKTEVKEQEKAYKAFLSKRDFTLEELATNLWLKHEPTVNPKISGPLTEETAYLRTFETAIPEPQLETHAAQQLWQSVILPLIPQIKMHKGALQLTVELLTLYDSYPDQSSVSQSFKGESRYTKNEIDVEKAAFDLEGTYEIYSKISLIDHICNVTTHIVKIAKESEEWQQTIADRILAALGHDLGKHYRQVAPRDYRSSHEIISAEKFSDMAANLIADTMRERITRAIRNHHSLIAKNDSRLIADLIQADHMARMQEKSELMSLEHDACSLYTPINEVYDIPTLRQLLVDFLTISSPDRKEHVYVVPSSSVIYIDAQRIKAYALAKGLNQYSYIDQLRQLRSDNVVQIIKIDKYDSYPVAFMIREAKEPIMISTIPINPTLLGISQEIINTIRDEAYLRIDGIVKQQVNQK